MSPSATRDLDSPSASPGSTAADYAVQHPVPSFNGYDHVTWWVGNAKQAASYYNTLFGFKTIAYRGLETGSRYIASYVVGNADVRFVFTSPLRSNKHLPAEEPITAEERALLQEIHDHLERHGDAVKDVALRSTMSTVSTRRQSLRVPTGSSRPQPSRMLNSAA